jgi:SecD/SecF fusion protein
VGQTGAREAQVQRVGTGQTFQISSKAVTGNRGTGPILDALRSRFGVKQSSNGSYDFDSTTVGPTFGRTVANSAVIAIIASLLVISAYVALRFDWKFAVPVLIALMHDLLITSGVYALTGKQVTVDTVAALLTILGYSLYDTIIVFDRVRENVPRMPRAAFSQIVNRSMSEVLTRSLATTSCTLLPIIALLLFGGSTLQNFAFALLIGVASGAYSSIFIASPVLTHWKERESVYRHRRHRILANQGVVAAYAAAGADVEPERPRSSRPGGRLTAPEAETVSAAEFERMKRDLDIERGEPTRSTSTLAQRLARGRTDDAPAPPRGSRRPAGSSAGGRAAASARPGVAPGPAPSADPAQVPRGATDDPHAGNGADGSGDGETDFRHAPDAAEDDAVARSPKPPARPRGRGRNRRHGRPR